MEISEPRLRTLLRQAEKVAAAGKRAAAVSLYRQIIEEAPQAEAAWLGLAEASADPEEKTAAFERVLQINPENETARTALSRLQAGAPAGKANGPFDQARDMLEEATARPTAPPREEQTAAAPDALSPDGQVAAPDHSHHEPIEAETAAAADYDLACYRHPDRRTALRCYTCNQPICTQCAVKTPVGYSCPDCIRDLQKGYYTATPVDYLVAVGVALPLSILAAYLVGFLGFFVFFVAPVVGTLIGRITFWAVRRRRGRRLPHLVAAAVILGALIKLIVPFLVSLVITLVLSPEQVQALVTSGSSLLGLLLGGGGSFLWTGLYAFLAAGAAYYFVKV